MTDSTTTRPDVAVFSVPSLQTLIAAAAILAIGVHLVLEFGFDATDQFANIPLVAILLLGGGPLVWQLSAKLLRREFGADLLAGVSIVASVVLGEYLAGSLVVLMLSGGEALEGYAVRRASNVLEALAKRMPSTAHRKRESHIDDVALEDVEIGDEVVVFPHEICPVDGVVVEGHGVMDEAYLTGEPYKISKTPGSRTLSGSINGDSALTIRSEKRAEDSRYAKIMQVMRSSEQQRPTIRRLGDQLGALYTPLAVAIALGAWAASGDPIRFLAVLVVATPCPLLIAIPVAVIGAISLAAQRAIIVRDPAALERVDRCRTVIFDKTGTLTYGKPRLTDLFVSSDFTKHEVLGFLGSLERYSKHPLASAVVEAAEAAGAAVHEVSQMSEPPGEGLRGRVANRDVVVTSRKQFMQSDSNNVAELPELAGGLECIVLIDGAYAATCRFRDAPRIEGASFVDHLRPRHKIERVMLVSGDRESEVRYLAEHVGIGEVLFDQSPEEKLATVRRETNLAPTVFVGDGVNDAPALMAATVGVAFGQNSDVTTEAADVVVMDSSLQKVDEFMHIGRRMRRIALESAVGGMALSLMGMGFASFGYLSPVSGAIAQEAIDLLAVLNALRAAFRPKALSDFRPKRSAESG